MLWPTLQENQKKLTSENGILSHFPNVGLRTIVVPRIVYPSLPVDPLTLTNRGPAPALPPCKTGTGKLGDGIDVNHRRYLTLKPIQ